MERAKTETLEEFLVRRFELVEHRLDGIPVTMLLETVTNARGPISLEVLMPVASRVFVGANSTHGRFVDRVRNAKHGQREPQIRI